MGHLVRAPNTGLPIQSPWLAIMNRQTEIARKLALPPAQRSRAALAPRPPEAAARLDEWGF